MNTKSIFRQAYESFISSASYFIDIIKKIMPAEMIFFLGGSIHQHNTGTILYEEAPMQPKISEFYFLILIPYCSEFEINQLEYMIEYRCRERMPVTVIIRFTDIFEAELPKIAWLSPILNEPGCCIYNSGNRPLPSLTDAEISLGKAENARTFEHGWRLAQNFFAGAEFYHYANQPGMVAFMLQQSAEHALKTILRLYLGDADPIHDIKRLLQLTGVLSSQLKGLFSAANGEDQYLLNLLDSAYLDSRYTNSFIIEESELSAITGKVKDIHTILQHIWEQNTQIHQPSEWQRTKQPLLHQKDHH